MTLEVGCRVDLVQQRTMPGLFLPDQRLENVGIVDYIGPVSHAGGQWLGVVLDEPWGDHDGVVEGRRYFACAPGHGLLVRWGDCVRAQAEVDHIAHHFHDRDLRRAEDRVNHELSDTKSQKRRERAEEEKKKVAASSAGRDLPWSIDEDTAPPSPSSGGSTRRRKPRATGHGGAPPPSPSSPSRIPAPASSPTLARGRRNEAGAGVGA